MPKVRRFCISFSRSDIGERAMIYRRAKIGLLVEIVNGFLGAPPRTFVAPTAHRQALRDDRAPSRLPPLTWRRRAVRSNAAWVRRFLHGRRRGLFLREPPAPAQKTLSPLRRIIAPIPGAGIECLIKCLFPLQFFVSFHKPARTKGLLIWHQSQIYYHNRLFDANHTVRLITFRMLCSFFRFL